MISSKRKPNLIETDRRKEFYNINFQKFLNNNKIKHYSRSRSLGAVFSKRYNLSFRDLLKNPVFEKGDVNWIDLLSTITKQYNNRVLTSTKLTPIQASVKKNEGFVCQKLLDKGKKIKPKYQVNDFVRVADLRKTFSKGDTMNWFYKLNKNTEINNDTKPACKIDILAGRYNESSLKKIELTLNETKDVTKKIKIT